jgi:hypothetical protein
LSRLENLSSASIRLYFLVDQLLGHILKGIFYADDISLRCKTLRYSTTISVKSGILDADPMSWELRKRDVHDGADSS